MKRFLLVLILLFILPFTVHAQSALMYEVPLEKQIASSSLIVEGKVISKESVWNNSKTLIYTINVVQV